MVKSEVALVRCQCSVQFLKDCRRGDVIPNCVLNCSKASKLFGNRFVLCERRFQKLILNRLIREKYRSLRSLRSQFKAATERVHQEMTVADAKWSVGHSHCMSRCVTAEESERLKGKLERLQRNGKQKEGAEPVKQSDADLTWTVGDLDKGSQEQVTEERVMVWKAGATEEEIMTGKGTMGAGSQNNRRVVIEESVEQRISEITRSLLALGPKFVPKMKVTKGVIQRAEMAVERLAFGRRGQKEVERVEKEKEQIQRRSGEETETIINKARPVRILDEEVELRRLTTTTKQGPVMDSNEENGLRRLKENIVKLYNRAKQQQRRQQLHTHDNSGIGLRLTKKEERDLEELRRDNTVVVKPSDKSKGFVILSRESYMEKASVLLDCPESYERCNMKVEDLEKHTRSVVSKIIEHKVPDALAAAMLPRNTRMSRFYGLPKDHKPGLPLRPVVSACGSPSSNISLLLERILNQLLKFVPAHLPNTDSCVKVLKKLECLPSNCIVASLDVVALYPNIPIEDAIEATMELLEGHREEVDMFYLSLSDIRHLLRFVLDANYFTFGNEVFRQRKGLAMGNHLAPPLAIIFMSKFETEALLQSPLKPEVYRRYIDDCLVVWIHGLTKLLEFVDFLNSRHPNIKFTIEHTEQNENHQVSYLDLQVGVDEGRIDWELFIKPSHSGVHLSFDSALPIQVKMSVAVEQFRRAYKNASTEAGAHRGANKIKELLEKNGFPKNTIDRAQRRARTTVPYRQRQTLPSNQQMSVIKLPFVDDQVSRQLRQTVRSYCKDVRVVFVTGASLKDRLVSSSLDRPVCPKEVYSKKKQKGRGRPVECRACDAGILGGRCLLRNVVYSMFCSLCGQEYVGETQRCIRERFQEHYRQARALTAETPWGSHYSQYHPTEVTKKPFKPFSNASILSIEPSHVNRRIMEATVIRDRRPSINNDCGWVLLDSV